MRILIKDLQPSTKYGAQFRTVAGNQTSDWSMTYEIETVNDTVPPPIPSVPVVEPYIGQLKVRWDGLGSSSEQMPDDFSHIEVHVSTVNGFTPSASTVGTTIKAAGDAILTNLDYGTTYYVKLVAVDIVGNKSSGSVQASSVPVRVSGIDVEALAIETTHLGDGAITAAKIADATITSAKIGTAQILNANIANAAVDSAKIANVSAGKITSGSIQALQTIVAGDAAGSHVELTSTGLSIYGGNPDGGVQELAQFGTGSSDFLSIQNFDGEVVASINEEGKASFSAVSIAGYIDSDGDGEPDDPQPDDVDPNAGFRIYGREFLEWLDDRPRGIIAWENFATDKGPYTSEAGYGEIGALLYPDRLYRITVRVGYENTTAAQDAYFRIKYTFSSSEGTAAAKPSISTPRTLLSMNRGWEVGAGIDRSLQDFVLFTTGMPGPRNFRFLLTGEPSVGTINFRSYGDGTSNANTSTGPLFGTALVLEDVGSANVVQGGQYNEGGYVGGTGSNPDPPPPTTYVKTWTATSSATYRGNGTKRTDTSDMVQGYNSANGDQEAVAIFPTSIQSTISSATVKKIECYLYANHWYYNSGGTAKINVHGYTSAPSSSPSMTAAVTSSKWPKPGGRWVTIPSSFHAGFKSGTYRGIGVGKAGTTSLTYYGRFNGAGASSKKPQIRITYAK